MKPFFYTAVLLLVLAIHCSYLCGHAAAESVFCNNTAHPIPGRVGVADGFCPVIWAEGLKTPRGLVTVKDDVLVLERGTSSILALWDDNHDGYSSPNERVVLATQNGLNHAIAVDEARQLLYASSSTQVFLWSYKPGQRTALGKPSIVVTDIPCCHHVTRSLLINPAGGLYVTVGSGSNVDPNDLHARIHYFPFQDIQNSARTGRPIGWNSSEVFARGLRNEVGITFDAQNRMWGVENGVDNIDRPDWNVESLHQNNPAEELNLFQGTNGFYGYPYCWSEGELQKPYGKGTTTQWAQPQFMNTSQPITDAWCQNPANVIAPKFGLPAHTAPMAIQFYYGNEFPVEYNTSAFVSLHGSWDRDIPQGYAVVLVHFNAAGMPHAQTPFLWHNDDHIEQMTVLKANGASEFKGDLAALLAAQAVGEELPYWMHRPVGLGMGRCGAKSHCVYVASDATGIIMAAAYEKK